MEAAKDELVRLIRAHSKEMSPQPTGVLPVLKPKAPVKAVIFDIYGTLFTSGAGDISHSIKADRDSLMRMTLEEFGVEVRRSDINLSERFFNLVRLHQDNIATTGVSHPEIDIVAVWRDLLSSRGTDGLFSILPEKDQIEKIATVFECRVNPVWPMPGLTNLLEELKRATLPLGIVSNAQFFTPLLFPALAGIEVDDIFHPLLCEWSYRRLEAKPSPRLFEHIEAGLAEIGLTANEAVYVGNDMLNDIYGARQRGFQTALFAGDTRSLRMRKEDPRCSDLQPDYTITELAQLKDILPVR